MKPYSLDLRARVVGFVEAGGTKAEAARHFKVCRMTVHRYVEASQAGSLAPKPYPGRKRKLASARLEREVARRNDLTLKEYAKALGVCPDTVWRRLRQLGMTLKKNSCATPSGTRRSGGSSGGRSWSL